MKNTIKITLSLVAMAMILVTACKKYPEGPGFSLRSKKSRLAGEWKFDKMLKNGTDITTQVMGSGDSQTMTIDKDGKWTSVYTSGSVSFTSTGTWEFVDSKENLKMVTDGSNDTDGDTSAIVKLKNNALWTEDTYGSDTYQSQYVPK
jgi:hypothetical protein